MKGAVHGDATITDKVPVRKELTKPEPLLNLSSLPALEKMSIFITRI
jgi:hypothetical protein